MFQSKARTSPTIIGTDLGTRHSALGARHSRKGGWISAECRVPSAELWNHDRSHHPAGKVTGSTVVGALIPERPGVVEGALMGTRRLIGTVVHVVLERDVVRPSTPIPCDRGAPRRRIERLGAERVAGDADRVHRGWGRRGRGRPWRACWVSPAASEPQSQCRSHRKCSGIHCRAPIVVRIVAAVRLLQTTPCLPVRP